MDLYKPEKYPVVAGSGQNAALYTVWNNPEKLIAAVPGLTAKCALIGTLYTRAGVAPMIRNLSLNPQIRRLYVWDVGKLSQNDNGRSGIDILRALWRNGIDKNGRICGSNFDLENEIDPSRVLGLVDDIKIVFASDVELSDTNRLCSLIDDSPVGTLRPPCAFPEPKPIDVTRWPSESVGFLVRSAKIIDAWQQVIMNIMRYGAEKGTQYGMRARELVGFTWVVNEDPDLFAVPGDWPEGLADLTGSSPGRIAAYLPTLLTPGHGPTSYGARLRAYPVSGSPLDQVTNVLIRNFRESPDARRAVATTMIPNTDWNSKEPPCLTTVQCLQADGRLNMIANLRSHDIFKGALPNAVGLRHLQKLIANEVGFSLGELMIVSASAHIYESDWANALKLVDCAYLGRKSRIGLSGANYDSRGNIIIETGNELISCALRTPEGAEAWKCEYHTATKIMARIAQLQIIIDPAHLMYIGYELSRAEEAIRTGQPYIQDR